MIDVGQRRSLGLSLVVGLLIVGSGVAWAQTGDVFETQTDEGEGRAQAIRDQERACQDAKHAATDRLNAELNRCHAIQDGAAREGCKQQASAAYSAETTRINQECSQPIPRFQLGVETRVELPPGKTTIDIGADGVAIDWGPWTKEMHRRLRPIHEEAVRLKLSLKLTYNVVRLYNGSYRIEVSGGPDGSSRASVQRIYGMMYALQVPPFPAESRVVRVKKQVNLGLGFKETVDAVPQEFYYR